VRRSPGSIGVAVFEPDVPGTPADHVNLLGTALRALGAAQASGRNCVRIFKARAPVQPDQ
jgi:hypothetical protein